MKKIRLSGRGAHPPENKNTCDSPIIRLDSFKKVQIPMSMHIGRPCSCIVKVGDEVSAGQKIGEPADWMGVPIHSSVSGTVTAIRNIVAHNGSVVEAVEIESDGLNRLDENLSAPTVTDKASFVKAVRESGLVGLGGASFPTHVKISPPEGKEPDILVVNAAECEPFITSDYRQCIEHPEEIVEGTVAVMRWLSIPSAVIGIEDNKMTAAKLLQDHIDRAGVRQTVSVRILKTIYPQGAEKTLIYNTTGRKVPAGGLPHDIKTLVLNVSSVRFIAEYLRTGIPLIRKNLTMEGGALDSPCNINVPIGAMLPDILEAIGGTKSEPAKIIMGGPMMGIAVDRADVGIIKANNAILVLNEKETSVPDEVPCIRCSRCVDSCPMDLLPTSLDIAARNNDLDAMRELHVMDCIECGCCAYVCPAKRYLAQSIRNGKIFFRANAAKTEVKTAK